MSTTRVLYRSLLRFSEKTTADHGSFRVRMPLSVSQWATGAFTEQRQAHFITELFGVPPDRVPEGETLTVGKMKQLIRDEFKLHAQLTDPEVVNSKIDHAFATLRELGRVNNMLKCTSVAVSRGVEVEVTSQHLPEQSNPAAGEWLFTYRIRIENKGEDTVQLLARQWDIFNGDGQMVGHVPRGSPGVVGHQPVLEPGQVFEYASGSSINTSNGTMQGSFQMVVKLVDDQFGDRFDATVAPFSFISDFGSA